jgi:hypothetical protein
MSKEIVGLIVPGVRNDIGVARHIIRIKRHSDVAELTLFDAQWSEQDDKVDRLIDAMGKLRQQRNGSTIVLFEISAGGALGLIAAHERPDWVAANALICARLRNGYTTLPSQQEVLDTFPAHANAVTTFERDIEHQLSAEVRAKSLTMIPDFDDVVPVESMYLEGATVSKMPGTNTHIEGISAAFSTHSQVIIDFIQRNQ